jgi:hypothetical protein
MLERVHQHIVDELRQSARTDTVFVVTAVVFNLIVLGINSAVADSGGGMADDLVLGVFIAMSLLVNGISITALSFGKQTRKKLLNGLLAMYRDNDVDQYYDASLLTNYGKRYTLFIAAILCLALTGIAVPLIIRIV